MCCISHGRCIIDIRLKIRIRINSFVDCGSEEERSFSYPDSHLFAIDFDCLFFPSFC